MNKVEHLLVCLAEEASEIVKDASKSLRFGLNDVGPGLLTTNRERLIAEINDLLAIVDMLSSEGVLPSDWTDKQKQVRKKNKVRNFMEYARDKGVLSSEKYLFS